MISPIVSAVVFSTTLVSQSLAGQVQPLKLGLWHYRSIPCVDTRVTAVVPRLGNPGQKAYSAQDFEQTGVVVTFATRLGVDPLYPNGQASVTHYQGLEGNDIMMRQRPGDRVQVCFLGYPAPTPTCDPDKDPRGRMYRVYDYRQRASYSGLNSEHDCGGA
jgi:hypothetical protein